jgi:DNA-binding CsgD family transcriptional regulator
LVDAAIVEQAEERGLVAVERDGRRLNVRLAHPLFGEVRRAEIGLLRARRFRGRISSELRAAGGRRRTDLLRQAVLVLDSDRVPDVELLAVAARDAVELFDLGLAERLARAAVAADGAFDPRHTLACILSWSSRGDEAEVELTQLAAIASGDDQRIRTAVPRAANLFWTLGRPADAQDVLDGALGTVDDPDSKRVLTGIQAAFHGGLGRPAAAIASGRAALAGPALPAQAMILATWGLAIGLGTSGAADQVREIVPAAYEASARSFDAALMRFGLTDFHFGALQLAGYIREAAELAQQRYAESAGVPGPQQLFGTALLGRAALAGGQVQTAVRWLREVRVGLTSDTVGWQFRHLILLTQALAMAGDVAAARDVAAEMLARRHGGFAFLDSEVLIARAWLSAADGAVSKAIALAEQAATVAASRGQLAYEVAALHTAVSFGERGAAARLGALAVLVDGPRASAAAAHAEALNAGDGKALHAASVRLEEMGDLLAAADAAAQATEAYAIQGLIGSGQLAAARTNRLVQLCEGASTPAVRISARPLALTDREREIVNLVAQGLSNRDIAERLTLSVRTVEGHLYRASGKLGAANRAELVAILRGN